MILLPIFIGLIAGLVGGFFGLSGAFIIITALSYLKMVPNQKVAAGTTLLVILPPVTVFAVYHYWKNKEIDFKLSYWMMGFYAIGAGLGAYGSEQFSDQQLKLYVAILFFVLGIISLITYRRDRLPIDIIDSDKMSVDSDKTFMNFSKRMSGATVL
jgi:uncharacterized membrane protein YfcA